MTNPVYRTADWAAKRRRVLARDGFQCQIGFVGCRGRANSADHIVEVLDGGDSSMENLQAACMPCNVRKMQISRKRRERRSGRQQW